MKGFLGFLVWVIFMTLLGAASNSTGLLAQKQDTIPTLPPGAVNALPENIDKKLQKIQELDKKADSLSSLVESTLSTSPITPQLKTAAVVTEKNMDQDYNQVKSVIRILRSRQAEPVFFRARIIQPINSISPIRVDTLTPPAVAIPEPEEHGLFKKWFKK